MEGAPVIDAPPDPAELARVGLCLKLLARALCPSAMIGEAENAACKLVHVARRFSVGFDDLSNALSPNVTASPRPRRRRRPAACRLQMPQGKYGGRTLHWIAQHDWQYLTWVSIEWRERSLREAAGRVVEFFGMDGQQ
jgi:hypothetical protein